jgi:hypothetical protein
MKGNAAEANNYRPIALTATMSKLNEAIINAQIVQFLKDKGILNKSKNAFMKKYSVAFNLTDCTSDWLVGFNSHYQTDVHMDFYKSFDSFVHTKMTV